jgi:type VI protein secretion system component VasK
LSLVEEQVALLVADEQPAEDVLLAEEDTQLDPLTADLAAALLKDADEVELISARLRHLCGLITAERHPFSPLSGALVLIPAAAVDCDRAANHTAVLAQKDLDTVRDAMQVDCPHVALVCDLEQTPGCGELLARFPEDQRQRRLGVKFPRLTAADSAKGGAMIEEGIAWLCDELIPPLVYRLLPLGRAQAVAPREESCGNAALYRFLYRLRNRRQRLTRILQRAMCADRVRPTLLGGCFLVATGCDAQRQQGFAAAVFSQVQEMKDLGNWTPAAVEQDRKHRRWAVAGYAALAALAALLLVAVARM